jgi:hypothetical protein
MGAMKSLGICSNLSGYASSEPRAPSTACSLLDGDGALLPAAVPSLLQTGFCPRLRGLTTPLHAKIVCNQPVFIPKWVHR